MSHAFPVPDRLSSTSHLAWQEPHGRALRALRAPEARPAGALAGAAHGGAPGLRGRAPPGGGEHQERGVGPALVFLAPAPLAAFRAHVGSPRIARGLTNEHLSWCYCGEGCCADALKGPNASYIADDMVTVAERKEFIQLWLGAA